MHTSRTSTNQDTSLASDLVRTSVMLVVVVVVVVLNDICLACFIKHLVLCLIVVI
jgi:hypothetical protein